MNGRPVVSNSSPVIALHRIGRLGLLEAVFGNIEVPPAVVREVTIRTSLPQWITETSLTQPIGAQILRASLGAGESEAIALALEREPQFLLLDDWPARRLALRLTLPVAGTLAVLVLAKRRGVIPSIKPEINNLMSSGFRASLAVVDEVLKAAGESVE